jgi:hypothetical protein
MSRRMPTSVTSIGSWDDARSLSSKSRRAGSIGVEVLTVSPFGRLEVVGCDLGEGLEEIG